MGKCPSSSAGVFALDLALDEGWELGIDDAGELWRGVESGHRTQRELGCMSNIMIQMHQEYAINPSKIWNKGINTIYTDDNIQNEVAKIINPHNNRLTGRSNIDRPWPSQGVIFKK